MSFSNSHAPTNGPSSSIIKSRAGADVYLVTGFYLKQAVWHYIEVPKIKASLFEKALLKTSIDLASFGTVLASGWGNQPKKTLSETIP